MLKTNTYRDFFKVFKDREFLYDETYAKLYECGNTKKVILVLMKQVHNCNIVAPPKDCSNRGQVNDEKLSENISRTKQKIFELAFCNPWQFFFTGTLDDKKYNRTDLEKFHKDFSKWIQNYNRLHDCNIKFLVVPELHKDGKSWHLHGFLMGLPVEHLKQFKVGDRMGKAITDKVMNGDVEGLIDGSKKVPAVSSGHLAPHLLRHHKNFCVHLHIYYLVLLCI